MVIKIKKKVQGKSRKCQKCADMEMYEYEQCLGPKSRALGHGKNSAGLVIRNRHTQKCREIERAKMDP